MRLLGPKRLCGAAALAMMVVPVAWGCSLASGWGGLEGGCRNGQGVCDDAAAGGGDAAKGDGDVSPSDAAPGDGNADGGAESGVAPVGAACGSTTCDYSQGFGCCADQRQGGGTCRKPTDCPAGSTFLWCDNSAECTALYDAQASCCFDFAAGAAAQCARGTAGCTGVVLCSSPGDCPGGQRCISQSGGLLPPGYSICMP